MSKTSTKAPSPSQTTSRRNWLKSLSMLCGAGLFSGPAAVLASPALAPDQPSALDMAGGEEYLGTVKILADTAIPQGWMRCDGQLLPVDRHPALFAVLGTTYGGNGTTTFALPNLHAQPAPERAADTDAPAAFIPAYTIAMKVANGPATTTAVSELRLRHHRRPRPSQAA